jgi:hypothetical protein
MRHIAKQLDQLNGFYSAEYAQLYDGQLIIRNRPYIGNYGHSLEEVKYLVKDGILYIKAKTVEWDLLNNSISGWYDSLLSVHEISQNWLDSHEIPEELILRNFKKRVWFFFKVNYKIVVDLRKVDQTYFKRKEVHDFEYCVHPFKLREA